MYRRILVLLALLGLAVALITPVAAAAGSAGAAASHPSRKTVTMTGTMHCSVAGSVKASPALTLDGSTPAKKTSFTLTVKMTKCAGNVGKSGAKITGGKVTLKGSATNNSCTGIAAELPGMSGSATYTTKGDKAAATTVKFSGGTIDISSSPATVTYPATGGTVKMSGSYKGAKGGLKADIKGTEDSLIAECNSKSGLSTIDITAGKATFG